MVDVMTITLHNFPGVNHEVEKTLLKKEENDRSGLQCLNRYCKLKRATQKNNQSLPRVFVTTKLWSLTPNDGQIKSGVQDA
jgi:hypothetical protein